MSKDWTIPRNNSEGENVSAADTGSTIFPTPEGSMYSDLQALCILPTASIREAMACIDRNAKEIALVVDSRATCWER